MNWGAFFLGFTFMLNAEEKMSIEDSLRMLRIC